MSTKLKYTFFNIFYLIWTVLVLYPLPSTAKKKEIDIWQIHETLANRLSAEWYKISILRNDLESIQDILSDLRDFQLYPHTITQLNEDKIIAFDKDIEQKEKKYQDILDKLNKLRMPLSDAIAILREMAVGQAVEDMFEVIKQGDMKRISEMLIIKHKIDILWDEVDQLINRINTEMALAPFEIDTTYGLEKEFFDIIKANLGQQSDDYYKKLNIMKNSLIESGNDVEIKQMYKIEIHRIKKHLENKNESIAKRKILLMKKRYKNRSNLNELNILLARVYFTLGDYLATLETIDLLPDDPGFMSEKVLYTLQSWYSLEDFEKIWQWGQTFDFSALIGKYKNLALWIVMESGLALDIKADFSTFAGQTNKGHSYYLNILHALGRTYIKDNQPHIALSIFEKALEIEPDIEIDKSAYNRILLTNAQTLYETTDYHLALKIFFNLLNNSDYFEEALYGIGWCYIKLNMYQKAETTLRKLINQSPQSPRSAEAILVIAKRFVNKAQYEWKKATYLEKEKKHLENVMQILTEKAQSVQEKEKAEKYKSASVEIADILKKFTEEGQVNYSDIRAYYNQALSICELIASHYETGSFQEISFSEKREKILHQLDSLTNAVKNGQMDFIYTESFTTQQRQKIQTVKKLVDKSFVLSAEIMLTLYKWEKEYLDWEKMFLSDKEKQIDEQYKEENDSTKLHLYKQQKNRLAAQIDSLIVEDNKLQEYWHKRLSTLLTQLLKTPLDKSDEIYLRYHMGELQYKDENRKFTQAYGVYEQDIMHYERMMALFNEGKLLEMPFEPKPPVLSHKNSMKQYKTIILKYPDDEFISAHCYSLAWCYNDLNMFDSAVAQMAIVAKDYSNSPYAPQAWMFLGEYFFDSAKLDSAIHAYRSVMKHPESEWFDEALYKLAWTQYRLSNPEKAISSFLALIDLGKEEKAGKALLETESLDYIAISFSESDITGEMGLKRAKAFCKKIGDTEKATQILHRLGGVYEDQGRFEMAIKTYRTLLNRYPQYHNSPIVESKLIAVMGRDLPLEKSNKDKIDFFKKYNRKSSWASTQTDSSTIALADSVAANQLYDASVTYHQIALQKNDTTAYNKAMSAYRNFIRYYPSSLQANECHYNLAEILFTIGQYYKAAEEYIAVSKRYPGSKYKETAAWNAIVASQNLLKQEGNEK